MTKPLPEEAVTDAMREAGNNLADAVLAYCLKHDTLGAGHTNTGHAWDLMKRREAQWSALAMRAATQPTAMTEEEVMRRALFDARNVIVAVGRPCPARTEAMERLDALLADYPPLIEQMRQVEAMRREAIAGGYSEPKVDEDAKCPFCSNTSVMRGDPAASFCDTHYRQYLATFQCYPKDLAAYRAARLEDGHASL